MTTLHVRTPLPSTIYVGVVMSLSSVFWLLVGASIGVAASFVLAAMWQRIGESKQRNTRTVALAIGIVAAIGSVAIAIYSALGKPELATVATAASGMHGNGTTMSRDGGGSMEAVTEQLAARLARGGGSDGDWQLLAQSYEFLGKNTEAESARKHIASAGSATASAVPVTQSTAPLPPAAEQLLAKAEAQRKQRHYKEARDAFEQAIDKGWMTADAWADYADVVASQANGKLADAAQAIDQALALQPNHAKALWLKASLAHEEHRYADALALWQKLRQVVAASPSDVRIIDANIAEAKQLAGMSPAVNGTLKTATVAGTIDIDPKLRELARSGATLFVFAKAVNAPGPPIAVWRTTVDRWPKSFKLDDTMAMMPSRTLSQFDQVVIEARISQSGQATAGRGDLQTEAQTVRVGEDKNVRLRIDKELS